MINYQSLQPADWPTIAKLMTALYEEDPSGKPISADKIQSTLAHLSQYPEQGEILAIKNEQQIVGYVILINFWSNEFGGNILTLDELYIEPSSRNQGIATALVKYLATQKYQNAVALQLETTPENQRANALYKRLGFKQHQNKVLVLDL